MRKDQGQEGWQEAAAEDAIKLIELSGWDEGLALHHTAVEYASFPGITEGDVWAGVRGSDAWKDFQNRVDARTLRSLRSGSLQLAGLGLVFGIYALYRVWETGSLSALIPPSLLWSHLAISLIVGELFGVVLFWGYFVGVPLVVLALALWVRAIAAT